MKSNKTIKSVYKFLIVMLEREMATIEERRFLQEAVAFVYGAEFNAKEIIQIVDHSIMLYVKSKKIGAIGWQVSNI